MTHKNPVFHIGNSRPATQVLDNINLTLSPLFLCEFEYPYALDFMSHINQVMIIKTPNAANIDHLQILL